ncbi:phage gp36-like protein [Rhizobium aquaticum]|uniref:Phage gp36-like protein n=1 Tax=Rhizobium aquaticum TaxID=1549636 RepID=A0ABV2ITL7_9HYPH
MTYATLDDLIARAGETEIRQIADRDRDGVIDAGVVADALAHADNLVNGYVATKYTLPFSVVPDLVRTWAIDIARWRLHFADPPEWVVTDYDNAIAALKDVAKGAITLPVSNGDTPSQSSGTTMFSAPDEVFSEHALRGW